MFWKVRFKLFFWKQIDCVIILVAWKTFILAYQILLLIGVIDTNSSNSKTKEIDHESILWGMNN